ncbi:hypothetical protein LRS06_24530 [Hymenobacter sp. J193]|uniref:hypothetical protein n=1 Tax=Hymenobacter sp. J193 TaxID=2898429 RepID=UPI0021519A30|nr:hypothetical protein [Hymenobacter sp. J193]MCR5890894.1 hypothetical protein [Hymenobacter sp. J193]
MQNDDFQHLWQQTQAAADAPLPALPPSAAVLPPLARVLGPLRPAKLVGVLLGLVWVAAVDLLLYRVWAVASPFFLTSAAVQVLLTKLMVGLYLYQLVLVQCVDAGQSVVTAQRRVARLQASTLWVVRLGFLQLPAWTTFFWTEGLLRAAAPGNWRCCWAPRCCSPWPPAGCSSTCATKTVTGAGSGCCSVALSGTHSYEPCTCSNKPKITQRPLRPTPAARADGQGAPPELTSEVGALGPGSARCRRIRGRTIIVGTENNVREIQPAVPASWPGCGAAAAHRLPRVRAG